MWCHMIWNLLGPDMALFAQMEIEETLNHQPYAAIENTLLSFQNCCSNIVGDIDLGGDACRSWVWSNSYFAWEVLGRRCIQEYDVRGITNKLWTSLRKSWHRRATRFFYEWNQLSVDRIPPQRERRYHSINVHGHLEAGISLSKGDGIWFMQPLLMFVEPLAQLENRNALYQGVKWRNQIISSPCLDVYYVPKNVTVEMNLRNGLSASR